MGETTDRSRDLSPRYSGRAQDERRRAPKEVRDAIRELFRDTGPPPWKRRRLAGKGRWYVAPVGDIAVIYRWLRPDELPADRLPDQARVAWIATLTSREVPVLVSLAAPLILALLCGGLALYFAPEAMDDNDRHARFVPLFGTTAQVIATMFVALVLEARQDMVNVRLAGVTIGYIALGVTAALLAGSPSLPGASYAWLLALSFGGGAGALATTLLIAFWGLQRRERERSRRLDEHGPAGESSQM